MTSVFLDTVGLLALWDKSDQWHTQAANAFAKIVAARRRLITTEFVFLECGNAGSRKQFRPAVERLRREIQIKEQLFNPIGQELENAWLDYRDAVPGSAGVVDLVSFAVMRRLNIVDAFTNDQHFRLAGFNPLF